MNRENPIFPNENWSVEEDKLLICLANSSETNSWTEISK